MKPELIKPIKERVDNKGRRWIQDHEKTYDKAIKKYSEESNSPNKNTIIRYLTDIRIGDRSTKRKVSKSRALRVFSTLQNIDLWLKQKPFQQVTVEDIKTLVLDLEEDIILSPHTKNPYTETTKAGMLKALRKFWKWLKNTPYYPEEVDWIDAYEPVIVQEIFSIEDVEYLERHLHSNTMRTILWILFDSGLRINELLNLRLKDIKPPSNGENYFTLRVRHETAKTHEERNVGLHYSNKHLLEYLEKNHQTPNKQDSFLFNTSYNYIRKYLSEKSKKHLNRSMTPKRLRGSSATHFASRIKSYQSFCYRYGWKLSSRVPDGYYNRAGVKNKEVMQQIHSFERTRITNEQADHAITNKDLLDENTALRRKLSQYEGELYKIGRYDGILNRLLAEPSIKEKARELFLKDQENQIEVLQ